MNLPNKLTLLRILLIIPVAVLTLQSDRQWLYALVGGLFFGVAAITDTFDGAIARKRGLVTDFGKLMDPVADKLLVTTALVCFVSSGICPPWVLIVVLAREFLVTSIRTLASAKGDVIPANAWGKVKTITQMVSIGVAYAVEFAVWFCKERIASPEVWQRLFEYGRMAEEVLFILAAVVTIVSGIAYAVLNKQYFKDVK